MAITYSWHISQLRRKQTPKQNTVETVEAYLYGEDENGKNTTVLFDLGMPLPDSYASGTFTEFDDLTKDQVLGWVTTYLPSGAEQELKDILTKKIAEFYENSSGTAEHKPAVPW